MSEETVQLEAARHAELSSVVQGEDERPRIFGEARLHFTFRVGRAPKSQRRFCSQGGDLRMAFGSAWEYHVKHQRFSRREVGQVSTLLHCASGPSLLLYFKNHQQYQLAIEKALLTAKLPC